MTMLDAAIASLDSTSDDEQLPAPPAAIYYNAKPKRRGRPVVAKPPTPALFQKLAGPRDSFVTVLVRTDNLTRQDLSLVNRDEAIDVDFIGQNDRSLPQILKGKHDASIDDARPARADMPDADGVSFDVAQLTSVLDYLAPAMSRDKTRYNLAGIYMDGPTWVATDGHRLHLAEAMPTTAEDRGILPAYCVETLRRAIKQAKAESVLMIRKAAHVWWRIAGPFTVVHLRFRMIDAQFPDYRQVLPQGGAAMSGETAAVLATLERGPVAVDPPIRRKRIAFFAASEGEGAAVVSKDGKDRMALPLYGAASKTHTAWYNADYLSEALDGIGESVAFHVGEDELTPLMLKSGARLAVVMPMRR